MSRVTTHSAAGSECARRLGVAFDMFHPEGVVADGQVAQLFLRTSPDHRTRLGRGVGWGGSGFSRSIWSRMGMPSAATRGSTAWSRAGARWRRGAGGRGGSRRAGRARARGSWRSPSRPRSGWRRAGARRPRRRRGARGRRRRPRARRRCTIWSACRSRGQVMAPTKAPPASASAPGSPEVSMLPAASTTRVSPQKRTLKTSTAARSPGGMGRRVKVAASPGSAREAAGRSARARRRAGARAGRASGTCPRRPCGGSGTSARARSRAHAGSGRRGPRRAGP